METISGMASNAAKAIWGESESNQEPISGERGDTSKGEPYDAGNMESKDDLKTSGGEDDAAVNHSKTTGTAAASEHTPNTASTDMKTKDSKLADPTKGQNDTRDPEDPQTNPKNAPADVDNTGEGPNEGQKLDGPGPRPINELAKEHGGDAGVVDNKDSGEGGAAGGDEEEDEVHQKSKGEGTGEQYVKSSGLKADGGDFDVTKPGAGREADRLLEQKGIHREEGPKSESPDSGKAGVSGGETKEKRSLGDKIKAKLHRN